MVKIRATTCLKRCPLLQEEQTTSYLDVLQVQDSLLLCCHYSLGTLRSYKTTMYSEEQKLITFCVIGYFPIVISYHLLWAQVNY